MLNRRHPAALLKTCCDGGVTGSSEALDPQAPIAARRSGACTGRDQMSVACAAGARIAREKSGSPIAALIRSFA